MANSSQIVKLPQLCVALGDVAFATLSWALELQFATGFLYEIPMIMKFYLSVKRYCSIRNHIKDATEAE